MLTFKLDDGVGDDVAHVEEDADNLSADPFLEILFAVNLHLAELKVYVISEDTYPRISIIVIDSPGVLTELFRYEMPIFQP